MNELGMCNMNFTQGFNNCVKILYYSSPTLKTESLSSCHCDAIYNDHGNYLHDQNSQVENTTSIIIYFGGSRILKWKYSSY